MCFQLPQPFLPFCQLPEKTPEEFERKVAELEGTYQKERGELGRRREAESSWLILHTDGREQMMEVCG